MTTGEATFDEIRRTTDRTLAYALLVEAARGYFRICLQLRRIDRALDELLGILTPARLESLTPEQARWQAARLQEVHRLLADFLRSSEARAIAKFPVLNGLASNLHDKTEDLDDLIENLD